MPTPRLRTLQANHVDLATVVPPRGTSEDAGEGEGGRELPDAQVIAAWQEIRRAFSAVDGRVECALSSADAPGALIHEALAAMAASPVSRMPLPRLAEVLGLDTRGCVRLVDRLVLGGYARRHRSATDRRVVSVVLTDDGAAHEQSSTAGYAEQLRIELGALGTERLAVLREIAMALHGWESGPHASVEGSRLDGLCGPSAEGGTAHTGDRAVVVPGRADLMGQSRPNQSGPPVRGSRSPEFRR